MQNDTAPQIPTVTAPSKRPGIVDVDLRERKVGEIKIAASASILNGHLGRGKHGPVPKNTMFTCGMHPCHRRTVTNTTGRPENDATPASRARFLAVVLLLEQQDRLDDG